ncbi:hypothetical protein BEH94_05945 [Candidatus Altiarchaeales archaeon WOR_SM1_SCG]|nr:hypothetical protein BEH94_05945 [Candidatus Altiarchaeales archaeon WOR_SM1_SCG]
MTRENIDWIFELKDKVPQFLDRLKGKRIPGFFHYSLSGDLYNEDVNWGLGNTVFAAKIYYTINLVDNLPRKDVDSMADFIRSFQKRDGSIYDPLITRKNFRHKLFYIRHLDFKRLINNDGIQQTRRAETRQSFASLLLLKSHPDLPYLQIPYSFEEVDKYLNALDWTMPWGAGSHFSHLLFFYKVNREVFNVHRDETDDLIEFAIEFVNKFQSPEDGSWYKGNSSIQQKVNGAMKIITGLKAVNKVTFKYPEKLIDLCLKAVNDTHACDNFNIIYVLKYANELTQGSYISKEIEKFCYNRLGIYRKYYYPEIGGFSFLPGKSNEIYYGTKITKGFNEPDIHGTVMFLWGIAIISQILGMNEELGFKEFIT